MARVSKYAQYNNLLSVWCKEYSYRVNPIAYRLAVHLGMQGKDANGAMRSYVGTYIKSLGIDPVYRSGNQANKANAPKASEWNPTEITTGTETNQYPEHAPGTLPSAWSIDLGRYLTIQEFCKKYGLNPDSVKSSKLVTHNAGHMTYNIAFDGNEVVDDFDYLGELEAALENIPVYKTKGKKLGKEGVISLADLHFGAYIIGLKETPDFTAAILVNMLRRAALKVNKFNYKTK